ncbi:hypothetical protein [Aliiroseovarius sp. PrR006]|uniref:DUF7507 domain-containing protein n=1 Tax=Aliiroseovarius sp. PrR006 TaxID=2706883 RepID=UPI0013D6B3F1|nr:hypothetical protein [Aliiroseovarius sp. PrR006]NDW53450.1 hypothetical protein [Aliiroseovarius sp. PrR006]
MPSDDKIILTEDEIIDDSLEVITDKDDYAPASDAEITVTGVDVGGTVTFEVEHVSDAGEDGIYGTEDDTIVDLGGDGHDAWTVTDGGEGDLDGEANGTIVTSWFVNPDDSLDETFLLSADDGTEIAYATFTDGPAPAYNLDQWKNGSSGDHIDDGDAWANGNLNGSQAHYYADDFVPYRATLSDLEAGTYFLTIEWDTTEGGQTSIDHLGTYDAGYTGSGFHVGEAVLPDPTDGLTPNNETTTLEIVEDPFYALNDAGDAQEAGVFTMHDATLLGYAVDTGGDGFGNETDVYYINSAPDTWLVYNGFTNYSNGTAEAGTLTSDQVGALIYTQSGDITANSQNSLTVIFEYYNETDGDAVLSWSGHIGSNEDWNDQANPSGSPYHMRLLNIAGYDDDGGEIVDGGGNQDRSLSRTAIILSNPAFEVTKEANVETVDAHGDVIDYTIKVFNTGDTPLTGIDISDPLLGVLTRQADEVGNDDDVLDAGEIWVYTGSYSVDQSDIDSNGALEVNNDDIDNDTGVAATPDGDIDNTVTVSFAEIEGAKTATADVDIIQTPVLEIEKTVTDVDGDGTGTSNVDAAGDVITYQIAVSNGGNQSLTNITVDDPLLDNEAPVLSGGFNVGDTDMDNELDVDETWLYSGSYTVTQDDIDDNGIDKDGNVDGNGYIDNTATADSDETDPADDSAAVGIDYNPALTIDKQTVLYTIDGQVDQVGDGLTGAFAGQEVSWQYVVTNNGNVTISNVYIIDDNGTPGDPSDDFDTLGTNGSPKIIINGDDGDGVLEAGEVWEGDVNGNGLLDVGESWHYSSVPNLTVDAETFVYTNIAYATGTTELDVDTSVAQDDSGYVVLNKGYVTNSSFCVIEDFNVLFSPDMDGTYTETSTQPGQFFYNAFETVENLESAGYTLTLHIPDGFALQSPDAFFESAVHVYDGIEVDPDCPELGFIWSDELSQQYYTVDFVYYGDQDFDDPDGRGWVIDTDPSDPNYGSFDVVITFDPEHFSEELEGNFAVNVHLDHETEGTSSWSQDGTDAVAGPGPDALANEHDVYGTDTILDGTNYEFYTTIGDGVVETVVEGSQDSVANINDFKDFKMKGVGGFIWDDQNDSADYDSGEGLEGYNVVLMGYADRKSSDWTSLEVMVTDEDGWYHSDYVHKGKVSTYEILVYDADNNLVAESGEFTLGKGDQFEIFNWEEDGDLVAAIA